MKTLENMTYEELVQFAGQKFHDLECDRTLNPDGKAGFSKEDYEEYEPCAMYNGKLT